MQASLRARDAGFTKIATTTRVLVVGAVAATGLFTVLAARAQPGRAKATTSNAADQGAASSPATANSGGPLRPSKAFNISRRMEAATTTR